MGEDSREHDLTPGVLALVVSLSEMIKDVQRIPALQLMRNRGLSEDELEGWRVALMELDGALDKIKANSRAAAALRESRPNFDDLVNQMLDNVFSSDSLAPKAKSLQEAV